MTNEKQRRNAIEHLGELVTDIPVAMLTTCGNGQGFHSRPMVNINKQFQGDLWFFTDANDPKVQEIEGNPQVNVVFVSQKEENFVSVSGKASTFHDPKRNELLWTEDCRPWFPSGPADQNLSVIQVEVERAEYWDTKKNAMVAVAGFFRSLAGSEKKQSVEHDKVDWDQPAVPPGAKAD